MRSKSILLFVVFALLSNGVLAQKAKNAPKAAPAISPALLYKVTGNGLKQPSFVFGTIHIACEGNLPFLKKVGAYLGEAKYLMLEVDLSDSSLTEGRAEKTMLPDGKSVKDLLTDEEFAAIDKLFMDYLGISYELLDRMYPTLAGASLVMSPKIVGCERPIMLDSQLAEAASALKMKISGLETPDEQMSLIGDDTLEDQLKSLKEMAADPQKMVGDFKTLYRAYSD
jgi:uncharacterized protein YbaP (TraB family)